MKIVVDQNVPLAEELFGAHGELVIVNGRELRPTELKDAIALICRSVTQVNKNLLADSAVEFVGSCTIGTDHLDIPYLEESNIAWAHAPGCNAQAVVEYVSSSLAALDWLQTGQEASVIGCGRVGGSVYRELEKLGQKTKAYDPFISPDVALAKGYKLTGLQDALAADIVCLHTPLTQVGDFPTHGMIGEKELRRLKKDAILISAGRGAVLQEASIHVVAAERPDIRWVLDVWEDEPSINATSLNMAIIATPHIAGYSLEGKQNGSRQVYQSFCEHFGFMPRPEFTMAQREASAGSALPPVDSLKSALLSVYNPLEDDARMREAFCTATAEDLNSGVWFDRLRKEYPVRRERAAYSVSLKNLSEQERSIARELGFKEETERA